MKRSYTRFIKPLFDYLFAFAGAIILSPILFLLYVFYLLNGIKSFFFVQARVGKDNHIFKMYKVKTLKDDRLGIKPNNERKFWFSDFIRKTSIDELPQLYNILKGEMSFIGPRPLLPQYLVLYNERQRKRHEVKPGITGLAQVKSGGIKDWENRLEMDVEYVENVSFSLDLKILFQTALLIFKGRDVNRLDEPFVGSGE